jgi:DNA polymerase III subunit delta
LKVKEAQILRALDNPDGKVRLFLLYGPDEAGSRALAARLERAMAADSERIDLDGATLKDDPARLADEAASFSLFGGGRSVRVIGGDECTNAVMALLEAEVSGNPVALIAGALKPSSQLLKAAIDHPAVMGYLSYKPEGAGVEALAVAIGRSRGLRLQSGVAARLAGNCLADREILEREIEKLALYLDAAPDRPRDATEDALNAVGADLSEADTSRLVDAVLNGELPTVAQELTEVAIANGWIPAMRALQRRIILLARLRSEVDGGKSAAAVVAAMGKAVFYKDQPAVTRQVGRWSSTRLATALARLSATEMSITASATAGPVIAANEMIAIARVGQKLR